MSKTAESGPSRQMMVSIARIAAILNAERDPDRALQLICSEAHSLFRVDSAMLWEKRGDELVVAGVVGNRAPRIQGLRIPVDDPDILACRCLRDQAPVLERNVPERVVGPPPGVRLEPSAAVLCVPLLHREEVLGVLGLRDCSSADRFTREDQEIVSLFSGMAAVSMANARLQKEMERRAREATVLSTIGRAVTSGRDVDEISESFVRELRDLLSFDHMTVTLLEGRESYRVLLSTGREVQCFIPGSVQPLSGSAFEHMLQYGPAPMISNLDERQPFLGDRAFADLGMRTILRVPVIHGGELLAMITLASAAPNVYGAREIEFLEQVAGQIAGVFANTQMVETQRILLSRLYSIHRITDAALSTLDLDSLLDSLLERSIEIVGADSGVVLLLDEEMAELSVRGARWMDGEAPWSYRRGLGEGIAGKVALEGKPRLIQEVDLENPEDVVITRQRGIHSVLAVPLRARERTIGVLRLESRRPNRFDRQHLQLMEVAAERMALAIDNARLLQEARERAANESLIHRIATALGSSLELDKVMETVVEELRVATDASHCVVALADPRVAHAWARWESRAEGVPALAPQSILLRSDPQIRATMSGREPIVIDDVQSAPLPEAALAVARSLDVRSLLSAPLFRGEEPIGSLEIYQYGHVRRWTKREVDLVQAVAAQLAVAAENARLYGQTDEKLRARVRELGSLLRLGRAVSEQLSPDVVMQRAAEEGIRALDADRCSISTADLEAGLLTVRAVCDRESGVDTGVGLVFPMSRYPNVRRALAEGQPAILRLDDSDAVPAERDRLRELGLATLMMLPLVVGDRAIGVMFFGRRSVRPDFSEEKVALGRAIAGQVAVAMENARLFQEVQAQKSRMEALLTSMSEGVYATDVDRRITAVNPWLESMLGRRAFDMVGRLCREVLRHTDEDGTLLCERACPLEAALQSGAVTEPGRVFVQTAWGDRLPTTMSIAPIRGESGEVTGAVAVSRDVTREWQIDKLKSNIISVVSHEFRTPLTSVLGFSELLLMRDQPEEERRQCLEHIHREALKLEALVNDFLDVSQLNAGKVALNPQPVEPAAAVARAIDALSSRAERHRLVSEIEGGLPPVEADPERLEQILDNLLSNAVKYSPEGSTVLVRARSASVDRDGQLRLGGDGAERWIAFSVEDQGVGIPPEQLSAIFMPFHRVEGELTRRIRGTGLGLSIVKSLVELQQGRLWVESEVGVGSRFHFALRAACHQPSAVSLQQSAAPPNPEGNHSGN